MASRGVKRISVCFSAMRASLRIMLDEAIVDLKELGVDGEVGEEDVSRW